MITMRRRLPQKVEFARDALVTLIHDRRMGVGDRLPSYARLRGDLGLGSQTIAAAVGSLCEAGVLEVRDKVGIFVKDPDGGGLAGRTIALAVRNIIGSAYSATLSGFIQQHLGTRNSRCLTFYQNERGDFPGLEQATLEHRCDGVIALAPLPVHTRRHLERLKLVCCRVGDDDEFEDAPPPAVTIAVREFLNDAVLKLREAGASRLVQLCVTPEQARRRDCGIPSFQGAGYSGGAAIARRLLALDPGLRPDGVVSDDDTVVSGFLSELVALQLPGVVYLPWVATIFHRELGELYPSNRMILFEQSISDYARVAVELLLDVLRGGKIPDKKVVYRFQPPTAAPVFR